MLDNNFLIYGETGTGKEVFAQSVHNLGSNSEEPFVPINCAAIPEGLFEGILFGTVKGSYTGAKDQIGLFEEAGKGTLFLDELNSMPIAMQTKLLRVLQEKRVRRVGGLKTKPILCRIISAVNENPEKLLTEGRLREDLFYRIAGYSLYIPPLRERKDDLLIMSSYFIKKYNLKLNKRIEDLSIFLKKEMLNYKWPGNVRELEHVIENLIIRSKRGEKRLKVKHLPSHLKSKLVNSDQDLEIEEENLSLTEVLQEIEKQMILQVLKKNSGNVSQSARDLGIIRQSLIYRIKKLEITKDDY
jgi:arginine utilization regulatory protein